MQCWRTGGCHVIFLTKATVGCFHHAASPGTLVWGHRVESPPCLWRTVSSRQCSLPLPFPSPWLCAVFCWNFLISLEDVFAWSLFILKPQRQMLGLPSSLGTELSQEFRTLDLPCHLMLLTLHLASSPATSLCWQEVRTHGGHSFLGRGLRCTSPVRRRSLFN